MSELSSQEKLLQKIKTIPMGVVVVLCLTLVTTIASGSSIYILWNLQRHVLDFNNAPAKTINITRSPHEATIFIDIEGAVEKPGIYEVSTHTRFVEAIVKANGLSERADRYFVARTFNLAKKLLDEDKIYIPFLEEAQETPLRPPGSEGFAGQVVNINTGSQTELELLPKVGPVIAQKIIQHRPYSDVNELVTKKAVSQTTLESIQEIISL